MPSSFRLDGVNAMKAKISAFARGFPDEVGRAQYIETEIDATECKRRTPVDKGHLRGSIHVTGPEQEGNRIITEIVAGGVAAPYAIYVHEDLEAFHDDGEAKFIESVVFESRPHMAERIARRIDFSRVK